VICFHDPTSDKWFALLFIAALAFWIAAEALWRGTFRGDMGDSFDRRTTPKSYWTLVALSAATCAICLVIAVSYWIGLGGC